MPTKLPQHQEDALNSPEGSRVLVTTLNKEIVILRKTIVKTQDDLEAMRGQYHEADTTSSVLEAKMEFYIIIEVAKYLISAVLTAWGFVLVSNQDKTTQLGGAGVVAGAAALYILLTFYEKHLASHKKNKNNA